MYGDQTVDLAQHFLSMVCGREHAAQDPVAASDFFEFM
jgi:hypothetical protein